MERGPDSLIDFAILSQFSDGIMLHFPIPQHYLLTTMKIRLFCIPFFPVAILIHLGVTFESHWETVGLAG